MGAAVVVVVAQLKVAVPWQRHVGQVAAQCWNTVSCGQVQAPVQLLLMIYQPRLGVRQLYQAVHWPQSGLTVVDVEVLVLVLVVVVTTSQGTWRVSQVAPGSVGVGQPQGGVQFVATNCQILPFQRQ